MTIALIVALFGGIVAAVALRWANQRKLANFLGGRLALSEEEFAALFATPLEGTIAVSIRALLAPWVNCDVSLVRPEDEFCGHLLLDALDGLDPEEFLLSVETYWSVRIPREEAADLKTIAQLTAAVAGKLNGMQSNLSVNADAQGRPAAGTSSLSGRRLLLR